MNEPIIDILSIEDAQAREKKFKQVIENAEGHQLLLANAYMELAKKNQDADFKKHTRFLKIFPQYFTMNLESFYADPEIETIKKLLLEVNMKNYIFQFFPLNKFTKSCTPFKPIFSLNIRLVSIFCRPLLASFIF